MFRPFRWAALVLAVAVVPVTPPSPARAQEGLPPVPKGIEVQARGPIHEAFASLAGEPAVAKSVPKQPPAPIEEMPPDEKPEGDAIWIGGYWGWDDDREDFLWVSGLWRVSPPGKQWVAGYWREEGTQWQWIGGFWTTVAKGKEEEQQLTYLPSPPEAPKVAAPGKPPGEDSFYVPGIWVWNGRGYGWRAGYYARVQPGYVWVADHYRWTPSGYVAVSGYWDLAVARRGILYAPVYISPAVVTVGFTYTPCYAVRDTVIVDSLFVHPTRCHYYFGDYYEVRYRRLGYTSCVVYSQTNYDSIIVYERYERRRDPAWLTVQVNLYNDRAAGRAAVPPRVLNQTVVNNTTIVNNVTNTTIVNNNTNVNNTTVNNNLSMVAPARAVAQTKNVKVEKLDETTRVQARAQSQAVQAVAKQRSVAEVASTPGAPRQARTVALAMPKTEPVKKGMIAPRLPVTTPVVKPLANTPSTTPIVKPTPTTNPNPLAKTPGTTTPPVTPKTPTVSTPTQPIKPANTTVGTPTAISKPGVTPGTTTSAPGNSKWLPAVPATQPGQASPATTQPKYTPAPTNTPPMPPKTMTPPKTNPPPKTTTPPPTRRPPPPKDKEKDKK